MNNEKKQNLDYLRSRPQNIKNSYLFSAIEDGDYEEVEKALEAGADVGSMENGDTPLHTAIKVKSTEIIRLLLDYNADVDIENKDGETALLLARKDCESCEKVIDDYFLTNENIERREEEKRARLEEKHLRLEEERLRKNEAMQKEINSNKNLSYLKSKILELAKGVKNETYYRLAAQHDNLLRAIQAKYRGGKRRKTTKRRKASKKTRKAKKTRKH